MAINRGKVFEQHLEKQFKEANICIDRLKDDMSGYKGSGNIADFTVFYKGKLFYLECKTVHGKTFNYRLLRPNQLNGLLNKSVFSDVYAGVLLWFVEEDLTIYIPIHVIYNSINNYEQKSFKSYDIPAICTPFFGKKMRVFYNYNLKQNLDNIISTREKYGY